MEKIYFHQLTDKRKEKVMTYTQAQLTEQNQEAAEKIVSMNQVSYEKYRQNVIDVFNNSFDKSIIIKQLDRILEDL